MLLAGALAVQTGGDADAVPRLGRMYSRFSFTAFGLPGRLTMSVLPRNTLAARLSIPRGVMERL